MIVMASGADFSDRANAGAGNVLLEDRQRKRLFPAILNANAIEGNYGLVIEGASADGYMASAGTGGDFNGMDFLTLFVASASATVAGVSSAGQTFVVYGGPMLPPRVDLASLLSAGGGMALWDASLMDSYLAVGCEEPSWGH